MSLCAWLLKPGRSVDKQNASFLPWSINHHVRGLNLDFPMSLFDQTSPGYGDAGLQQNLFVLQENDLMSRNRSSFSVISLDRVEAKLSKMERNKNLNLYVCVCVCLHTVCL